MVVLSIPAQIIIGGEEIIWISLGHPQNRNFTLMGELAKYGSKDTMRWICKASWEVLSGVSYGALALTIFPTSDFRDDFWKMRTLGYKQQKPT